MPHLRQYPCSMSVFCEAAELPSNLKTVTKMAFTDNEIVAMIHENESITLKALADYIEKWQMSYEDVVKLLRDISDEQAAQSMVVELRDKL